VGPGGRLGWRVVWGQCQPAVQVWLYICVCIKCFCCFDVLGLVLLYGGCGPGRLNVGRGALQLLLGLLSG
jgi:hypothetical protein